MIPIRRYPYTDFHDLNLDFLLNQFSEYEDDIDDLKKRVKILEDWREVIDGDIIIIKNDITDIKGDIVTINNTIDDHSRRINTIEGDIVTINNTIDDHSRRILRTETDLTMIKQHWFQFNLYIPYRPTQPEWSDISEGEYTKQVRIDLYDPNYNPDRSEMISRDSYVEEDTEVQIHFTSFEDYEKYSDIICGYVTTEDPEGTTGAGSLGYLTIKFKEIPADYETLHMLCYCQGFILGM